MPMWFKKMIGWAGLFIGLGGAVLFFMFYWQFGRFLFRMIIWAWAWLPATFLLTILSAKVLHRLSASTPAKTKGPWRISLLEMLAVNVLAGLIYLIFREYFERRMPDHRRLIDEIALVICLYVGLVVGFLSASRRMILRGWSRWLHAVGVALCFTGLIAVGSIFWLAVVFLASGNTPTMVIMVLIDFVCFPERITPPAPFALMEYFRAGLISLPIGLISCWLALDPERSQEQPLPYGRGSDSEPRP